MALALHAWLSSGTVQIAIAIIAVGVYILAQQLQGHRPPQTSSSAAGSGTSVSTARIPASHAPPGTAAKQGRAAPARRCIGTSAVARASHSVFQAAPTVSIDCRALFSETDAQAADNGVTLDSSALEVVREAAHVSKVSLLLHDTSADGMLDAIVRSSLEGAGIVGDGPSQIPRHRLLVCSTAIGKVAIVRQLEAARHIECDPSTHDELSRFGTQQWLCARPGGARDLAYHIRCNAS